MVNRRIWNILLQKTDESWLGRQGHKRRDTKSCRWILCVKHDKENKSQDDRHVQRHGDLALKEIS